MPKLRLHSLGTDRRSSPSPAVVLDYFQGACRELGNAHPHSVQAS